MVFNLTLISLFILSFILFYIFVYVFNNKFPGFFGICESNEKTSLKHKKMYRGLGIFFLLTLFPFIIIFNEFFNAYDLFLLFLSSLIGFWDDKKVFLNHLKLNY